MFIVVVIFGRFLAGVIWYKWFAEGNLINLTGEVFLVRLVYDCFFTYPVVALFLSSFSDMAAVKPFYILVLVLNVLLTIYLFFAGYIRA